MTGYLLDTNAVILTLMAPDRLPADVRRKIAAGTRFVSVLTYWEVILKSMKGTLDFGDPRAWWPEALEQLGATPVPLTTEHVAKICALPSIHQDPFDRALVAQAISEGLTLVTADADVAKYPVESLRIR
jgi:PIN domain nuclease of toxin-antitoxin system